MEAKITETTIFFSYKEWQWNLFYQTSQVIVIHADTYYIV